MAKEKPDEKAAGEAEKKEPVRARPKQRPPSMIEPYRPSAVWRDFDRVFESFRRDFEDILWPSRSVLDRAYSIVPIFREEWPNVDLEDRGTDFCLTVEVPGFKKEDIEIEVEDKAVEIRASTERKREEKTKEYLRRERAERSFHRRVDLPEEIVADKVEAKLDDGVLELVLPKKTPKVRKKITIK